MIFRLVSTYLRFIIITMEIEKQISKAITSVASFSCNQDFINKSAGDPLVRLIAAFPYLAGRNLSRTIVNSASDGSFPCAKVENRWFWIGLIFKKSLI